MNGDFIAVFVLQMVMRSGVKYLFLLFIKLTLLDIAVEHLSLKALLFPWVIGWIGLNNENGFYLHGLQVAAGLLRRAGNPGCFPNQPNQGCFCYLVLIWCWTILLNECWLWAHHYCQIRTEISNFGCLNDLRTRLYCSF